MRIHLRYLRGYRRPPRGRRRRRRRRAAEETFAAGPSGSGRPDPGPRFRKPGICHPVSLGLGRVLVTATVSAASVRFACSRRRALRAAAFAASTRIAARIISARSSSRKNQGLYARADVTVNVPFASARASFMPSASFPANEAVASAGITTCTYGDENTGVSTRCLRFFEQRAGGHIARTRRRERVVRRVRRVLRVRHSTGQSPRDGAPARRRARVGSERRRVRVRARIGALGPNPRVSRVPTRARARREVVRVGDAKRRVARVGVADVSRE